MKSQPIHLKGASEHNLKDLELFIPKNKLIAITGRSGSGKSSLVFDTLYLEGRRKYFESLSLQSRQLLQFTKKPKVDFIHHLPPVAAVEQHKRTYPNQRSMVSTSTEISDQARILWLNVGTQYDPVDQTRIERVSLSEQVEKLMALPDKTRLIILAPILKNKKTSVLNATVKAFTQLGFQRIRVGGNIQSVEERLPKSQKGRDLDLVVDRLLIDKQQKERLRDSLDTALRQGKDTAIVLTQKLGQTSWKERNLSTALAGQNSGIVYEPLSARHLNWNHPLGLCPTCSGLGYIWQFTAALIVPDGQLSLEQGAIRPFRIGAKSLIIRRKRLLRKLALSLNFKLNTPWQQLPAALRSSLLHGPSSEKSHSDYKEKMASLPFRGFLKELERLFKKTHSEFLLARLSAFQNRLICPSCCGQRLNARGRHVLFQGKAFPEFLALSVEEAWNFSKKYFHAESCRAFRELVASLEKRLKFLQDIGLGYLQLNRPHHTLSGGESQRVYLAAQIGSGLSGICYALDEPSIGLHPKDNACLMDALRHLRDQGNTIVIIEHDLDILQAADYLIEIGPGAGKEGGNLVFQGTIQQCLRSKKSITGKYLREFKQADEKQTLQVCPRGNKLTVHQATARNLKNIEVSFPVGYLNVVCGVSGSGKSTLVGDILAVESARILNGAKSVGEPHGKIEGLKTHFENSIYVTQSPIGTSPRSNPATYTKLFDPLRQLFAQARLSQIRGYTVGRFSFNRAGGRCQACKGDGQTKVEMQFLGDIFLECPSCQGTRYNRETLQVHFKGHSISDVLNLSVREALRLFENQSAIYKRLKTLEEVGLDYLKLGQASTTLSGGESQRIKLALELSRPQQGKSLYILDEPTTGLHAYEVEKLIKLLRRFQQLGNTLIIIEHHPEIIRHADWVVELGPQGGQQGGEVIFQGSFKALLKSPHSVTAPFLK